MTRRRLKRPAGSDAHSPDVVTLTLWLNVRALPWIVLSSLSKQDLVPGLIRFPIQRIQGQWHCRITRTEGCAGEVPVHAASPHPPPSSRLAPAQPGREGAPRGFTGTQMASPFILQAVSGGKATGGRDQRLKPAKNETQRLPSHCPPDPGGEGVPTLSGRHKSVSGTS